MKSYSKKVTEPSNRINGKNKSHKITKKKRKQKVRGSLKKQKQKTRRSFFKEIILSMIVVSIITLLASSFFVTIVTVRGFSMVPTLREKDKVLVRKTDAFKRFDVVVFDLGKKEKQIRRIIGFPGETIRYQNDILYINDQPIDEKYLIASINENQKNGKNYTEDFSEKSRIIPDNYYFVLGDNRPYATDSRYYGLVEKKNIIGKVTVQIFPVDEIKLI